jgi:hypothetical protein
MKTVLLSLALLTTTSASSDAGQGQTLSLLYCTNASWGGYCQGNLWTFHNQGQPGDYASFSGASDGTMIQFVAVANGAYYSCRVPYGSSLSSYWPTVLEHRNFFSVQWDTNGNCDWVWLENDSRQGQSW